MKWSVTIWATFIILWAFKNLRDSFQTNHDFFLASRTPSSSLLRPSWSSPWAALPAAALPGLPRTAPVRLAATPSGWLAALVLEALPEWPLPELLFLLPSSLVMLPREFVWPPVLPSPCLQCEPIEKWQNNWAPDPISKPLIFHCSPNLILLCYRSTCCYSIWVYLEFMHTPECVACLLKFVINIFWIIAKSGSFGKYINQKQLA